MQYHRHRSHCPALCFRNLLKFSRHPTPAKLGTFAYPPEITLSIAQVLDSVSLLSLSLTCRFLYQTCFPYPMPALERDEREGFLLLLEKDTPHVYYCHFSIKLHEWRKSFLDYYVVIGYLRRSRLPCELIDRYLSGPRYYRISYRCARFVMNRHFYSAAHGVLAERLNVDIVGNGWIRRPIANGYVRRARIVDDQLLILSVQIIKHRKGDAKQLREYINRDKVRICWHLRLRSERELRPPTLGAAITDVFSEYFTPYYGFVKSCHECMTDYQIDVTWHRKEGWIIELKMWQQLGSARSPYDWNWQAMKVYHWRVSPSRRSQQSKYPPEIVRHTWSKADDVVLELEGEWA